MSAPRAFSLLLAVAEDPRSSQHLARFISAWVAESPLTTGCVERCWRATAQSRTVSQRSEPSSRTALMGEQPNPWEVLPPQDATSRHRAISVVTDGADYLSTLLRQGARGRRLMATVICLRFRSVIAISPPHGGSVVTGSCLSTDFPRCCPQFFAEESTVISRFLDRVATISPQI